MVLTISIQVFLWIWFLGCVTTWRFGKVLLVEGMGIKSWEFVMLCLYSIALIAYYYYQPVGKWVLLSILALWFTVQFFCHWHYTLFGVSEKKLKEYNECFKETFRLIPISEKRLVPDLYHIVLYILIFLNDVICMISR